jgi:Uma2 family endonuclease
MSVGAAPQVPGYFAMAGFRRWSVDEYHRLIDSGFLGEKDPIHLLEGNMVLRMPPNPPHSNAVTGTIRTVVRLLPDDWQLRSEQPITLADSEPQPDVVLARGDRTTYRTRHPGPADIGLVVEVSDTSLPVDRIDMGRIYARSNLPVYWIINVVDRQVEVYTDSRPADSVPAYATRTDYRPGDGLPLILDGQVVARIPVIDLLD